MILGAASTKGLHWWDVMIHEFDSLLFCFLPLGFCSSSCGTDMSKYASLRLGFCSSCVKTWQNMILTPGI